MELMDIIQGPVNYILVVIEMWIHIQEFLNELHHCGVGSGQAAG